MDTIKLSFEQKNLTCSFYHNPNSRLESLCIEDVSHNLIQPLCRENLSDLHLCFQPSQIFLEIAFDHRSHQKIRETIEGPSGSLHSDRSESIAGSESIKLVRHVHWEWAFDRLHDHEMIRFKCPYLKNVIDGAAHKLCSSFD